MVLAGSGDFQGPAAMLLAPHLLEIQLMPAGGRWLVHRRRWGGLRVASGGQPLDGCWKVGGPPNAQSLHESGFGPIGLGD